jgi:hypothetical protein
VQDSLRRRQRSPRSSQARQTSGAEPHGWNLPSRAGCPLR